MAAKDKLIIILMFSMLGLGMLKGSVCVYERDVKICVTSLPSKDKGIEYYLIVYQDTTQDKVLKKAMKKNLVYFQFYAKHSIYLINNLDTMSPVSYLFEDDASGISPVFKQIVGFKTNKIAIKESKLKIELFNQIINIDLANTKIK